MKYLLIAMGTFFTVVPEAEFKEGNKVEESENLDYLTERAECLNEGRAVLDNLDGYYSDYHDEKIIIDADRYRESSYLYQKEN